MYLYTYTAYIYMYRKKNTKLKYSVHAKLHYCKCVYIKTRDSFKLEIPMYALSTRDVNVQLLIVT